MTPVYSNSELVSFANFLRFDFLNGFDILKYTLTDISLIYIVVAQSLDLHAARKLLATDYLMQALDFYESYGAAVGMRTLYDFVETYYRCNISTIGLARKFLPSWYFPPTPYADMYSSPLLSQNIVNCNPLDRSWSMARYQHRSHDLKYYREKQCWELNSIMNKPLFETFNLRKWAMDSISREGINFKTFQSLVLASYWFQDRHEIMKYFESTCSEVDRSSILNFLDTYTSKDIATEMEVGRISSTRFDDAFPDILVIALIGCDSSMTGAQLARHLFMCSIDLAGDAKDINSASLKGMCRRQRSYKRKVLLEQKVRYLSECWSPRIKLVTKDLREWKGSYTVEMLDEYIRMMRTSRDYVLSQSFKTYALGCR